MEARSATPEHRPALDKRTDPDLFVRFYYLKEELLAFCRANGMATSGSKTDLAARVEHFLRTGRVPQAPGVPKTARPRRPTRDGRPTEPALDAPIGPDFKCTEARRAFFEAAVGPRFHFSVKLQRFLRANPTATYADAIEEWRRLDGLAAGAGAATSSATDTIDPQFEYNRYIRAFFADNPGRSLKDAIACWRLRRSLPGPRAYVRTDLSALGEG